MGKLFLSMLIAAVLMTTVEDWKMENLSIAQVFSAVQEVVPKMNTARK
jgi:hypothetical protein